MCGSEDLIWARQVRQSIVPSATDGESRSGQVRGNSVANVPMVVKSKRERYLIEDDQFPGGSEAAVGGGEGEKATAKLDGTIFDSRCPVSLERGRGTLEGQRSGRWYRSNGKWMGGIGQRLFDGSRWYGRTRYIFRTNMCRPQMQPRPKCQEVRFEMPLRISRRLVLVEPTMFLYGFCDQGCADHRHVRPTTAR